MDFNSPADSILFGLFFGAFFWLVLMVIYAVCALPLSMIEWRLFYGKSIFKNKWQAFKINTLSLLMTALCSYVYFFCLMFIPDKAWLECCAFVILFGFPFVLFLLVKLWAIGFMSKNRTIKIQLLLFNLFSLILFCLIVTGLVFLYYFRIHSIIF